jgi:hypothetical protein
VAESTVATYMIRHRKPPSQTWRTFLENHVRDIAAIDFFVVPTVRFQLLYCFVVLRHDDMTGVGSPISTSRLIRPRGGPLSKSSRPSLTTKRLVF